MSKLILILVIGFSTISSVFAAEVDTANNTLCGNNAVLIDGICEITITHHVNIFANKGFITFLIILIIPIIFVILIIIWKTKYSK